MKTFFPLVLGIVLILDAAIYADAQAQSPQLAPSKKLNAQVAPTVAPKVTPKVTAKEIVKETPADTPADTPEVTPEAIPADTPEAPPEDIANENPELTAIRQSSSAFEEAFNSGNGAAVAAMWTEDGDYIDETGEVFSGRKAIEQKYQEFFAENQGQRIRIVIDALRLLSDGAAIEDGHAWLESDSNAAPDISKYTAVHVKVDGKWLMSTVRDSMVKVPAGSGHVEDLEWLIGTWVAEEYGSKTVSVCRWLANNSTVERTYTVTRPDQTTTSGVQLIHFNPQEGQLKSWNFSPDGGVAIGIWSPRDQGWSAKLEGTLADGTTTTATNLLTRLDDNAYVWQSIDRTVGGMDIPDTEEVVLKRQKK